MKQILLNTKYWLLKCIKKCIKYTIWKIILWCFPSLATKIFYKVLFGKFPNFKNPCTINEKMQLLKIGEYYNNHLVTECIDKLLVKKLLVERFHVNEIGLKFAKLYNSFDTVTQLFDFGFESYPTKFVIKCNHGSGYNFICTNKNNIDEKELRKTLKAWMKDNYWEHHVEYQYRVINKKIFVEEFLENHGDTYKIYCFHGKPQFFYVSNPDEMGNPDVYLDFFDMNFNHLPISLAHHKHSLSKIEKPDCFDKLLLIATNLSKDFPFVRVDLYVASDNIYFSELTFLPTGGYMELEPEESLKKMGDLLSVVK